MERRKAYLAYFLCAVLAASLAFAGCGGNKEESAPEEESGAALEGGELGEGSREFAFSVVDGDGEETRFSIHTDKETVGEALEELGLIEGEEGQYGLYVKTVNGITADPEEDGAYWAFYEDGEYASSGVDGTAIEEGVEYALRLEKE